jgi:hypothetical protein
LEVPNIHPPQDINVDLFNKDELAEARKKIKEGMSYGDDGIAPEILKRVDLDDVTLHFCNRAFVDGSFPNQWRKLNIVPVSKKGNLTKVDNNRGIALTSIVSKTLNRMILNKIRPAIEGILDQPKWISGRSQYHQPHTERQEDLRRSKRQEPEYPPAVHRFQESF